MKIKNVSTVLLLFVFLLALGLSSCGNSKHSKVRSKSEMGNVKDKNKHVWGK